MEEEEKRKRKTWKILKDEGGEDRQEGHIEHFTCSPELSRMQEVLRSLVKHISNLSGDGTHSASQFYGQEHSGLYIYIKVQFLADIRILLHIRPNVYPSIQLGTVVC